MDTKEQLLNTLEELSKIKQTLDQKFIEEISKSTQNTSDPNFQSLVKMGVEFANSLVEGRRSIEKTILNSLKSAGEKPTASSTEEKKENYTGQQGKMGAKVGTISIRAANTLKSVKVPINVSNNSITPQDVEVIVGYLRNMESGKQAISKIRIDRPKITLDSNSSEKVLINFDLNSKLKPENNYFTTILLRGLEDRIIEVIIEIIAGTGEESMPEIKFSPAG